MARTLKGLEVAEKFMEAFDPENSNREKRKLSRFEKLVLSFNSITKITPFIGNNKNLRWIFATAWLKNVLDAFSRVRRANPQNVE